MAHITKRLNKSGLFSYLIRVYLNEDENGKQKIKSKTWKPPINMKQSTADKQAQKEATLFENKVKNGLIASDGKITFKEYAENWIKHQQLAYKTATTYKCLFVRINKTIGNISLEKLQAHNLQEFYKSLKTDGENSRGGRLSDKTILHHHRLISAVLETAKRERLIPFNVASEHMKAPKVKSKEAKYLNEEEAKKFLKLLLQEEDIRIKASLILKLFTGVRKGELCGLSWQDIDEAKCIINISKASQYQSGNGIVEVATKTRGSNRFIDIPKFLVEILKEYKVWWQNQKKFFGKEWEGEQNRLFIQERGRPLHPDTINFWLNKFIRKHNLPRITPHSLRHTFATLQITSGVDIRTIQSRTGHSQSSTLINIYSHEIKRAQVQACNVLENILLK